MILSVQIEQMVAGGETTMTTAEDNDNTDDEAWVQI